MKIFRVCLALALMAASSLAAATKPHLGKSLQEWSAQLDSTDRTERLLAARALGEMAVAGDAEAVKAVFQSMDHADSAVRFWAVVAAGQMGERARPAVARLQKALEDDAPEVRAWAAYALAKLGRTDEGVQALIRLVDNPEKGARLQALHALDELGTDARPATEALRKAVDDEFDYVQRVARHALWVLGERPCPYKECQ